MPNPYPLSFRELFVRVRSVRCSRPLIASIPASVCRWAAAGRGRSIELRVDSLTRFLTLTFLHWLSLPCRWMTK